MPDVMTMDEWDQLSPDEQDWYLEGSSFTALIKCGRCGRVIEVGGAVWKSRLRGSHPVEVEDDETGEKFVAHLGWNGDRCADIIEGVGYGYGGAEY